MACHRGRSGSSVFCIWIMLTSVVQFCRSEAWEENIAKCASNSPQSELNSFLWTLEREPPSYFFGTIHVPYTRVWDYIPQSTKNAFRYAHNIYFELDLTDGATAAALASCQLLPEGKTIAEFLSKRLYRRLTRHMDYIRKKIPDWMGDNQKPGYSEYQYKAIVGSWHRMKPVWLMLMLNSLTESDIRLFGVPVLDLYLSRQAVQWQKKIGAIEEVDEQCAPLNKLNHTQVIFALDQTLKLHEEYRRKSQSMPENDDLIAHYNCGDLKSVLLKKDTLKVDLTALQQQNKPDVATMAKQMDNYFQTELLDKRNVIMSKRIIKLLEENPKESFFFAFGAGHYLGNNSVIDSLIASGLPITHTKPDSFIQSYSKRDSYNQEPFSHMDSSSLLVSHQYMDALKKLNQAGTSGDRSIRHGKHKGRRRSRDPRERFFKDDNRFDESSFTKLWIKVEEISRVTEDTISNMHPRTETSPVTSQSISVLLHQRSATYILPLLVTVINHFIYQSALVMR